MWDLVPWPRIEPSSLHWESGVLPTGPPWKNKMWILKKMMWLTDGSHPPPLLTGGWTALIDGFRCSKREKENKKENGSWASKHDSPNEMPSGQIIKIYLRWNTLQFLDGGEKLSGFYLLYVTKTTTFSDYKKVFLNVLFFNIDNFLNLYWISYKVVSFYVLVLATRHMGS